MPYYYYGFDPTYVLVLIGAVICLIASARVKSTFNKYSQYRSMSGMTGAQAAERILNSAGIYDVTVCHIAGNLTDHYNPSKKTLNLSRPDRPHLFYYCERLYLFYTNICSMSGFSTKRIPRF